MVSNNSVVDPDKVGSSSLRHKIARRLLGHDWQVVPIEAQTTVVGFGVAKLKEWEEAFQPISRERRDVYADMEEMDDEIPEVSTALDILADEAVYTEEGDIESYEVIFQGNAPAGAKNIVHDTLERVQANIKAYQFAREMLKYGDCFVQLVFDKNLDLCRLMYMPPATMKRNEDAWGLLKTGDKEGEFAFEQYAVDTGKFLGGLRPFQMSHLRWRHTGASAYGRAVFYSARDPWRKLRAMEEALVINWLTRAFARLLFILDVTGMEGKESEEYIKNFRRQMQTRKIGSGVLGDEVLSTVKDIYIGRGYLEKLGAAYPSLNDVKVLDTSTTVAWQMGPIEYYRHKLLIASRVPKAYMGLERDVNAKATLTQQERRFARGIRRVQWKLTDLFMHAVNLQLLVLGYDPRKVKYFLRWPNPSRIDELDASRILYNRARADNLWMALGVYDAEYARRYSVKMSEEDVTRLVSLQVEQSTEDDDA